MVSHKNIPRIHVQGKWDNNNTKNGVQIQVTSEGKLTNYRAKTKHIPNTSSKTKYKKESNGVVPMQNENEKKTIII